MNIRPATFRGLISLLLLCASAAQAQEDPYKDAIPDWEMVKATMTSCQIDRFDDFLNNFIENNAVQMTFTDFEVKRRALTPAIIPVHGMGSDVGLKLDEGIMVNKDDYQGQFRITMRDYYIVDAQSVTSGGDYKHLSIETKRLSPTSYRVDWSGGEFRDDPDGGDSVELIRKTGAPGAYIFEFKKGCWHLTQDLRGDGPEAN